MSGNPKVVKAGRLTVVASGPRAAYERALPYLERFGEGVTYVGEGDSARLMKIYHNLLLGVVAESMAEIAVLAERGGVERRGVLRVPERERDGVDVLALQDAGLRQPRLHTGWFTPELLCKDFDLGLDAGEELGVPLPTRCASSASWCRRRSTPATRALTSPRCSRSRPPVRGSTWPATTERSPTAWGRRPPAAWLHRNASGVDMQGAEE